MQFSCFASVRFFPLYFQNVVAYLQAVLEQEHSTAGDPGTTSPSKESESGHDG